MREMWKSIKGFEGIYSVSNLGDIRHEKTEKKTGTGNYARQQHILKQRKNNKGYMLVDLYKENKRYQMLVHRVVAMAFLDNPNNYSVVNHKDENPLNNKVVNLEWCSQKYNMNYGNVGKKIGKANSKAVKQVDLNGNILKIYPSAMQAQRETGISNGLINECVKGKRTKARGFIWEYAL